MLWNKPLRQPPQLPWLPQEALKHPPHEPQLMLWQPPQLPQLPQLPNQPAFAVQGTAKTANIKTIR